MIWCVEDDSGIREIEVYTLNSTGFEARGFADGASFREALETETPELVLLDVMLPGEDGVSLLRYLRSCPGRGRFPLSWPRPRAWSTTRSRVSTWEPTTIW